MKELEILKLQLEQYMDDYDAWQSEHDEKSILIETLLDSESTDVVDVRLVGQVYDHYKEKCKKLQEANAKIDSLEKAIVEIKVKQAIMGTVSFLFVKISVMIALEYE